MNSVSIIVPTRIRSEKEERWFTHAINSVMAQTVPVDLLVVENGCERKPSHNHKARVIKCNEGLAIARNAGADACKTPYFMFLDIDDFLPSNAVELYLQKYPGEGFIYGSTMLFRTDDTDNIIDTFLYKAQPYNFDKLMGEVYFPNGAMQKKSDWEKIGGWRENLPILEDWDYWLTAGEMGICGFAIPDVLYWYRQNPSGMIGVLRSNKQNYEAAKLKVRKLHQDIYKGEYPMACCGGKRKSKNVTSPTKTTEPLVGGEGMILVKYLMKTGDAIFYGPVTGTRYIFGAGEHEKRYIDVKDARTGSKRTPGLLELREYNNPVFEVINA